MPEHYYEDSSDLTDSLKGPLGPPSHAHPGVCEPHSENCCPRETCAQATGTHMMCVAALLLKH